MDQQAPAIAFGPVASRRLGQSLGINNIPPKRCSYSCVYCQVGRTRSTEIERVAFYEPSRIAREVGERLSLLAGRGETVDHIAFVPDGEPTLDARLGEAIELVRPFGAKIAVITNSSLIDRSDVRDELGRADWISLKVDSASEPAWRRLNAPHPSLGFQAMLRGLAQFAESFRGTLVTDTMLIRGINDSDEEVKATAALVASLAPAKAYFGHSPRDPRPSPRAQRRTRAGSKPRRALRAARARGGAANRLCWRGLWLRPATRAGPRQHRCRAPHARRRGRPPMLDRAGSGWEVVDEARSRGRIERTTYRGQLFFVRRFDRCDATLVTTPRWPRGQGVCLHPFVSRARRGWDQNRRKLGPGERSRYAPGP